MQKGTSAGLGSGRRPTLRPVKKTLALTASAVLLAVAIAASAYFLLIERGGLPDDPILIAPEDTSVILRADVKRVVRSEVFQKLVEGRGLDAAVKELAEECGYDFVRAVDELFVFVRPEGETNTIALVGAGRFDVEAASRCFKTRMESDASLELEEMTLEGFRALGHESIRARVAFVGSRGIVLGEEPMVIDILKRVRGEIPRLDKDSHLAKLYRRMSPRRDLVLAAGLPKGWHLAAHDVLEPRHAYELAPTLMHLHEFGLGLTLREELSFGSVLVFDEEAESARAHEAAERTLDAMKKNFFLSLTPVAPALAAIQLEREGKEVRVGLELTAEQIADVARVAKALGEDDEKE